MDINKIDFDAGQTMWKLTVVVSGITKTRQRFF